MGGREGAEGAADGALNAKGDGAEAGGGEGVDWKFEGEAGGTKDGGGPVGGWNNSPG